MRWTRKTIIAEINRLHDAGEPLNYSTAEDNHLNLVRAAAWHFGTWRRAVESSGVDYQGLSRYQRWSKSRIVERIRELNKQNQDLSWHSVSKKIDPPLAAAAVRAGGFKSWRDAISAAGINVESVARYKVWDEAKVIKAIRARKRAGEPLSSKSLQKSDQPLFSAGRRRFGSWDAALAAAGLNAEKIRLRRHNSGLNAPRQTHAAATQTAASKTAVEKIVKPATVKPAANKSAATKSTPKNSATKALKKAPVKRGAR